MADTAPDVAKTLALVPIFADLKRRQLQSLAKVAKRVEHRGGQEVAAQGRAGLAFHVIASGDADVLVGNVLRRTLHPGDYFGEISMIDGQPRSATVVAGDGGLVTYAVNRTDFVGLVNSDSDFARAIMVALCGRIRASELAR